MHGCIYLDCGFDPSLRFQPSTCTLCTPSPLSAACAPPPVNYTLLTDVDNVVTTVQAAWPTRYDVNVLAGACNGNAQCKGFNNYGWWKNNVVNNFASPDVCLYA